MRNKRRWNMNQNAAIIISVLSHDDVIKWKHFPRNWPFVRGIPRSPVPGEFPAQRQVTRSFDVFFDLHLNKRLSKQSWGWWFETLSRPLWRHCNEYCMRSLMSGCIHANLSSNFFLVFNDTLVQKSMSICWSYAQQWNISTLSYPRISPNGNVYVINSKRPKLNPVRLHIWN